MALLLTGATGFVGSYVLARLLEGGSEEVLALVRASDAGEAERRLWTALQPHFEFEAFRELLGKRVHAVPGDLTRDRLGWKQSEHDQLTEHTDSVIHCAAALSRRSEKSALNVNFRGSLAVILFAKSASERGGLRRLTHVSTVAVAGERKDEVVAEDEALDWGRADYDPYARSKKMAEHLLRQLLPPERFAVLRPSVVLGDSRRGAVPQLEMAQTFAFFAGLPVLPLRASDRLDIVPVDYVADAVVAVHEAKSLPHDVFHVSAGTDSPTYREITNALAEARGRRRPVYWPWLGGPFRALVHGLASMGGNGAARSAGRLEVFWPYLTYNTVFDNARIREFLGRAPPSFPSYCAALLEFARENHFRYPYKEWPE